MPGYLNANPDIAQNGGNRQVLCEPPDFFD
jgi:hypothetical protein